MERQTERFMEDYRQPREMIPPEDSRLGGVTSEMARRWKLLQLLQDRNETLFYSILMRNFEEMAPILYTPTVGWVCVNYHKLYRRPRGMFFSAADSGNMAAMAHNWPQSDVHAIVVTDGSRILGLGDLGLNGLGIPIGKLDLYCAAGGFSPSHVLPAVVDVGTDNEALRSDPLYAGLRSPRLRGAEYYRVMDEFVEAVMSRWPRAVLQFEDFSAAHAEPLLQRYRDHHTVFNDDIQGTAATALAGLYGALRVMGLPPSALAQQRVVMVGAGSAGTGVMRMIAAAMVKHGLSPEAAASRFWVLDRRGLVTTKRPELTDHIRPFARREEELDGMGLMDVVNRMECTAQQAVEWTGGRAIFAGGSPQEPVAPPGGGPPRPFAQANNMYLFPGIALGAFLGRTGHISDAMLVEAAEALPDMLTEEELGQGLVYPSLRGIRAISAAVALAVCTAADREDRLGGPAAEALEGRGGPAALLNFIVRSMYWPDYKSLVPLPRGVEE
ncbi:hypothetical protein GPECTOR_23g9 [Gonium pectorale]|uniref:Malic enzyme n=1 Tax=Gonium pectorale TaxID=33097 RepID=A0A150GH97_GONPE|nr:hypothetical protein GPECTOR_23g9 [Gonium pectorale]|eukprot:KXZ49163.1 hypothetical protein GPECTOR_23g9 [Gonium pectorale]